MAMLLTKHGFNANLINVEHLDAIFDLIEGKWSYRRLNPIYNIYYFVYDNKEDIFTKEVLEHQKFLGKKFWFYKNHRIEGKLFGACSIDEFNELVEKDKKEREQLLLKQQKRKEKIQKKENADRGIYGIYYNGELIYIGKTDVDFEIRFKQHQDALTSGLETQYLYKYLKEEKKKHGNISITFNFN